MLKKLLLAAGVCLLLSIPVCAGAIADDPCWRYLDANPPGPRSAAAYSLAGHPIRPEVAPALKERLTTWDTLSSPVEYECVLLSLIKLGEDPTTYNDRDLLSPLYSKDALGSGGLDDITGALLVYSACGKEVPQSQPNSPNALIDRVMAAQQQSGGFAETAGEEPSAAVTARAITALFPYQAGADVKSSVRRALTWLSEEQNGDGTFSVKGLPSGSATAETLLAVSLYRPDSALFERGGGIDAALEHFRNHDGGFSEVLGGPSSTQITELAVIARYTAETGLFPYYAPDRYPGYVKPEEPAPASESPWASYGKFLIGFILIFFLIYLLLILTIKIGKFAEKKKLPGSLAAQAEKEQAAAASEKQDGTIQLHIPMQPAIPDFDDISEQESEIGHPSETDKR